MIATQAVVEICIVSECFKQAMTEVHTITNNSLDSGHPGIDTWRKIIAFDVSYLRQRAQASHLSSARWNAYLRWRCNLAQSLVQKTASDWSEYFYIRQNLLTQR